MRKRLLSALLALSMLLTMAPTVAFAVEDPAENSSSEASDAYVTISKTAKRNAADPSVWDVTMTVTPKNQPIQAVPLDVVLVLDTSTSMSYDLAGNSHNVDKDDMRITLAAQAAKDLIDQLASVKGEIRVGLVTFNEWAEKEIGLTSLDNGGANQIKAKIPGRGDLEDWTDIGDGLVEAGGVFDENSNSAEKVVILLTDGKYQVPNYGNHGNFESVVSDATQLKNQNIKIYTVGFTTGSDMNQLKSLASSPAAKYCYSANNYEELTSAFTDIAYEITAMVNDSIGDDVVIANPNAVTATVSSPNDAKDNLIVAEDGTHLLWNPDANEGLKQDETLTITYQVKLKKELSEFGVGEKTVNLNGNAVLSYQLSTGEKPDPLSFPVPTDTIEIASMDVTYQTEDGQAVTDIPESNQVAEQWIRLDVNETFNEDELDKIPDVGKTITVGSGNDKKTYYVKSIEGTPGETLEAQDYHVVVTLSEQPPYKDGHIHVKLNVDGTELEVSENITNYLTISNAAASTTQGMAFDDNTDTITYKYETYNSADVKFTAKGNYIIEAVDTDVVYGQSGYTPVIVGEDNSVTVDNIKGCTENDAPEAANGAAVVTVYLRSAYSVEYYLNGTGETNKLNNPPYNDTNTYVEETTSGLTPVAPNIEDKEEADANGNQPGHGLTYVNTGLKTEITIPALPSGDNVTGWYNDNTKFSGVAVGPNSTAKVENWIDYADGNTIKFVAKTTDTPTTDYTDAIVQKTPVVEESITLADGTILRQDVDYIAVTKDSGNYTAVTNQNSATVLFKVEVTATKPGTVKVTDEDATYLGLSSYNGVTVLTETTNGVTLEFEDASTVTLYFSMEATFADEQNQVQVTNTVVVNDDLDNTDTSTVTVDKQENENGISISKTVSAKRDGADVTGSVLPGDVLTYTITVANTGNTNLMGVHVEDVFTAAGKPEDSSTPPAAHWDTTAEGQHETSWTFDLDVGESQELTYTYTVQAADAQKTITNTATVTDNGDPGDNTAKTETEVTGFTLTYDANGGNANSVPTDSNTYTVTGEPVTLDTTTIPTHDPAAPSEGADAVDVLFIGWMAESDSKKIYSRNDNAPDTVDAVTFEDSDITVYAAWGYDEDGNGIPDVIEKDHIVITPADIIIYTGGTGYSGIVDENGDEVEDSTTDSNGFPEPGYYITLPADLDEQLKEATGQNPVNLSDYLTFSYNDEATGTTREWRLERYDNKTESMAYDRYIYRLVPTDESYPDVRLSITDENGTVQTSDNFEENINTLYQEYDMGIYAGDLDQGLIKATVKIPGATEDTQSEILVGTGLLVVRGTTDESAQIALDGTEETNDITAEAADDSTFTINGSDLQVANANAVQLLVDELVDGENSEAANSLKSKADETFANINAETHTFDFKYMDLVDNSNGNAWVKTDQDLTITWAYPNEVTEENVDDYNFAIVHYPGLDRNYDNAANEIASTTPVALEIERTEDGLRFTAGAGENGFSPFALVYDGSGTTDPTLTTYQITYDPNGGSGDARTFEYVTNEQTVKESLFSRDNYTFTGWNTAANGSGTSFDPGDPINLDGDIVLYAQWSYNGGNSGGTTRYTLTYESNGGTEFDSERYTRNTTVQLDKTPTREGYTFTGWYADEDLEERITEIKMTSNKTVYAGWEPTDVPNWLNGDDHFSYIIGREDGLIHPDSNITRAEVATIFFRLLQEDVRDQYLTESNSFTDVSADAWYNTAISTMARMGIVEGDLSGTFRPDDNITRAEFAAIAARFSNGSYDGADIFNDIADHWAREEINLVASTGWLNGYTSGSFNPNREITRAESMTIVNRMLKRLPENTSDLLEGMIEWPDNQSESAWYYLAVQEATNSHDFERKDDGVHESWTELTENTDWEQYQ